MDTLELVEKIRQGLLCPNCLSLINPDVGRSRIESAPCSEFPPDDFTAWPDSQVSIQALRESALNTCQTCVQLNTFINKYNDKDQLVVERASVQWGNIASGTWFINRPFSPFTHGEIYEIFSEDEQSGNFTAPQLL